MSTRRLAAKLLYDTDPVRPTLEEEDTAQEGSSEIWRNLE